MTTNDGDDGFWGWTLISGPIACGLEAAALMAAWGWFLTPLGIVAPPSIVHCAGLVMVARFLFTGDTEGILRLDRTRFESHVYSMANSAVVLSAGWFLSRLTAASQ